MPIFFRLAIFSFLGFGIWALTEKFRLKDYSRQKLSWLDAGLLVLGIGLSTIYGEFVHPLVGALLTMQDGWIYPLRDFFYNSSPWIQFTAHLIFADFLAYWMHRLLHSHYVWPFHAFHHSPKSLNVLSGMRGSFVHYVLVSLPYSFSGFLLYYTGHPGFGIATFTIEILVQHHTHSALNVPYYKYIEKLFITPRLHFVHHHPNPNFTDSNYGFLFSCWDKTFGTFTDPESIPQAEKGQLGLDYELSSWKLFLGFRKPKADQIKSNRPGERAA